MRDKTVKRAVNVMVEGVRVRQYIYFEREDKAYIKEQAKAKGVSVSKYLVDIILKSINEERQIELDLK